MKNLLATTVGTVALSGAGVAFAQNGDTMNSGLWALGWMSGHAERWVPFLLVVALVGLVELFVEQKGR